MEPTYSFEEQDRLLRLRFTPAGGLDEWVATMQALVKDPRFRPGLRVLADRTLAPAPDTAAVRTMMGFIEANAERFRGVLWAMVVPDTVSYGMARMGQAILDRIGLTYQIFHDVPSAERWLRGASGTP